MPENGSLSSVPANSAGRNNWRLVAPIRATDINFTTPQFDTFRHAKFVDAPLPCLALDWSTALVHLAGVSTFFDGSKKKLSH